MEFDETRPRHVPPSTRATSIPLGRLFVVALVVTGSLAATGMVVLWLPVITPCWLVLGAPGRSTLVDARGLHPRRARRRDRRLLVGAGPGSRDERARCCRAGVISALALW